MTTTEQRPQHSKPRTANVRIAHPVYLRHPDSVRVLTLNGDAVDFIRLLEASGYIRERKPTHD